MTDFNSIFELQQRKSQEFRSERISLRKTRIRKILNWTLLHRKEITKAVHSDLGKPEMEAEITEVYTVVSEARFTLSNIRKWTRPQTVETPITLFGVRSKLISEPKGTCLIVSPWNFPFNLTVIPLISSLAAGNTAIIKPSEHSPATALLIKKMISELFAEDEVKVICGGVEASVELLKLPFDHIFFTGSPQVGKIVMEAAAKNLSGLTLELGGKNPVFVAPDASLSDTARKLVWAKFMNCGQSCISPDYVWIHEDSKEQFLKLLLKFTKDLYDNGNNSESYGRIVNANHLQRLKKLVDNAVDGGAVIVNPSKDIREGDKFFPPTFLEDINFDSSIMQEEIFGPVLPVLTYRNLDHAIADTLKLPKPLASYVFCKSSKYSKKVNAQVSAGALVENDCLLQFINPELPFGGVNFSGMGKSHGHYGFKEFSNEKPVMKQIRGMGTSLFFHPPYTTFKKKLINLLIKYF